MSSFNLFLKRILWAILFLIVISVLIISFVPLTLMFWTIVPIGYWLFTGESFYHDPLGDFIKERVNNPELPDFIADLPDWLLFV